MISIRAITMGVAWSNDSSSHRASQIIKFKEAALSIASNHRFDVRTVRLTLPPINSLEQFSQAKANSVLNWFSSLCEKSGIRWYCVPLSYYEKNASDGLLADIALDIIRKRKNAFVNLMVGNQDGFSQFGISEASHVILSASKLSTNGFDNFRIGVSCNVKPHTPFFPFSFHSGTDGFSLALEVVNTLIKVKLDNNDLGLELLREKFHDTLISVLKKIEILGLDIEAKTGIKYIGLDTSLAPFPDGECSVARLIELLGVEDFGSNSSIFFTAYLTKILKSAIGISKVRSVGFNGVMYSVLEDNYLAKQVKAKNVTMDGLLAYSTVCGCGIDMVPVPGNIVKEEINGLIMDIAGIAMSLNKPLGVRILPVPGKGINEMTDFNYDFLVDTRVMENRNKGFDVKNLKDRYFKLNGCQ